MLAAKIDDDKDSKAMKHYLSINRKVMRINEKSENLLLMMYKTVCDYTWEEARAHILKSAKTVYNTSNSRLISFAGNPWWFYHISRLHQFAGYHPTPFTLDQMTLWKPCGSDFAVPFIRMGNVALRILCSTYVKFPKYTRATNEKEGPQVMSRLAKLAAKPHKMQDVHVGFLNAAFFEILEVCYREELGQFKRLFGVQPEDSLPVEDMTWARVFNKYKKRMYTLLRTWADEQQDGKASAVAIELAKEVVNKMKWFLDGQVLANGITCPKMETPTPFICPTFITDVASDMTLRQWAVLQVSFQAF